MVEFFVEEEVADAPLPEGDEPGDAGDLEDAQASQDADASQDETPDSIEALASEIGWRPDGALSAKEFILKSRDIQDTMRTHIQDQKKQLSELGMSVAELKAHNERVYKAEVSKLTAELADLKKEKRAAIEDGDADKVDELDTKISGVQEAIAAPKPESKPAAEDNPALTKWLQENPWYDTDPEMATFADAVAAQNPGAPYERVLKLASLKAREMFPDKFAHSGTPPAANTPPSKIRTPASPVEGAGRRAAATPFTKADLTPDQINIMNQFVRQNIMTEQAYIADIAKTQGV